MDQRARRHGLDPVTARTPNDETVADSGDDVRPLRRRAGSTPVPNPDRLALQAEWLNLTRVDLPALAVTRGWPIQADHCFQRILLDAACDGRWYDHITGRPAYAHAPDAILTRAIALGRAAIAGGTDMAALNRQSLGWRGKA